MCKKGMPTTKGRHNRDVKVDPNNGNVYPIIDDAGNIGDLLDNILDHL